MSMGLWHESEKQQQKLETLLPKFEKKVQGKYYKEDGDDYVIVLAVNRQYMFNNISKEFPMRFIDTFTERNYEEKLIGIYRNLNFNPLEKNNPADKRVRAIEELFLRKGIPIDFDNLFTERERVYTLP